MKQGPLSFRLNRVLLPSFLLMAFFACASVRADVDDWGGGSDWGGSYDDYGDYSDSDWGGALWT